MTNERVEKMNLNLAQEFRVAAAGLRTHLRPFGVATLTLAIGLAAALAILAVVDAVLVRELPYPQADRIVQLRERSEEGKSMALAGPNYSDLRQSVDALEATGVYVDMQAPLGAGNQMRRVQSAYVGDGFFQVLGVAPALGRTLPAGEREHVAVISHALWNGLFGARTDVLGQSVQINGESFSVVGVMPEGFAFPAQTSVWMPLLTAVPDLGQSRTAHNFEAIGRLRSADALMPARLAASTLATRLAQQYGDQVDAAGFDMIPLREAIAAPVRDALLLLGAGAGFLLLIATTNAGNLLLAMHATRVRERAVRGALGASQARLARSVLLECMLMAALALMLGLGGAQAAIRLLAHSSDIGLPRVEAIELHGGLIVLGVVTSLAIAVAVTAAVLWSQRRQAPMLALREGARGTTSGRAQMRLRVGLLIAQTALTTVLLVGAGLLGRSFLSLMAVDPGFQADSALSIQLTLPWTDDAKVAAQNARRYSDLIGEMAAIPGVSAVGGINALPLTADGANGSFWDGNVTDPAQFGAAQPLGYAEYRVATPDYFKAAGIRVLAGRSFDSGDAADGLPVAVVSAVTARAAWGDADPIGRQIQFGNMDGDLRVLTVVGVVDDVHERSLDREPMGTIYVDLLQRPRAAAQFSVVVRSQLPLQSLLPSVRSTLQRLAADIPQHIAPLAEVRGAQLAGRRAGLSLLGVFTAVAFVLAIGGLYSLMAFAVSQRRHEFALRQALGASRARILRLVLGAGALIGACGIGLGLGLALVGAQSLRSLLFGVPASDPLTLAMVAGVLLATALLACLLPAARAAAVEPRDALA